MEQTNEVETAERATAQLTTVLALLEEGKLRCSPKTRRPTSRTVRLLADTLPGGDFYIDQAIAAYSWPLLVQAGSLADDPRLQLTPRGRAARRKPAHDVLRLLWQRWLTKGIIDEFSRVEAVKGQRRSNVLSAIGLRRQLAAASLTLFPADQWIDIDDLFSRTRAEGLEPAVHRTDTALWRLYLDDPEYGSFGYLDAHPSELLAGRYLLAFLFEYAATLGLIDVRYQDPERARDDYRAHWGGEDILYLSRYDGLRAIRVNSLGRYCLAL